MCVASSRRQPALRHPDDESADEVDGDDDQSGDRVPFHKLHGTVHGTVELALLLDLLPAPARLVHVDHTGAHVAVDAHLLAGHGVEGEARAHFRYPLGALGVDHELDDGDDQENDHADDQVARHDEVAERVDDGAGVRLQQDQASGRDRQGQPEQRGEQQHGRKREKLARRRNVDGEHQQNDRDAHAGADQYVHQFGGQRQNHHEDDGDQQRCEQHILALRNSVENVLDPVRYDHQALLGRRFAACARDTATRRRSFITFSASRSSSLNGCCNRLSMTALQRGPSPRCQ